MERFLSPTIRGHQSVSSNNTSCAACFTRSSAIVMLSLSILVNEAFDDWNGAPRLTPYSTEAASPMSKATTVVEEIIQRSHAEEWTSPHFRDSLLVSFYRICPIFKALASITYGRNVKTFISLQSQPVSARKNGRLTTLGDYPYHPDWDVYWQKTPGNLQTHPTEQEYRYMTDHFK